MEPGITAVSGWVDNVYVSAVKRAARAAVLAYLGVILAGWFGLGDRNVSGLIDAIESLSDEAGGTALLAAIGALGWRAVLDPSSIPSLNDAAVKKK